MTAGREFDKQGAYQIRVKGNLDKMGFVVGVLSGLGATLVASGLIERRRGN
jgi:hypothetical protein